MSGIHRRSVRWKQPEPECHQHRPEDRRPDRADEEDQAPDNQAPTLVLGAVSRHSQMLAERCSLVLAPDSCYTQLGPIGDFVRHARADASAARSSGTTAMREIDGYPAPIESVARPWESRRDSRLASM